MYINLLRAQLHLNVIILSCRVLLALESSNELPVGDKSSPEDIWKVLPGLSKAQFKAGVGALLRFIYSRNIIGSWFVLLSCDF